MTTHSLTYLYSGDAVRLTPNGTHSGMDITIQNTSSSGYVYLGGEGVNSESFGYRLSPNSAWSIELPGNDAIYAVTDSSSVLVAVLMTNLESGE